MRFTPHYMVSYKGEFHKAGKAFNIDSADAEEMSKHGIVEAVKAAVEVLSSKEGITTDTVEKPVRKGGRPRKNG